MVRGADLERLVRRLDRQLGGIEAAAIRRLDAALRESVARMESELRRLYQQSLAETLTEGQAMREARARVLLAQTRSLLTVTDGSRADDVFMQLIRQSYGLGAENALASLSLYQQGLVALSSGIRAEVLVRATNASARLAHRGVEFGLRVERHVIDGITRGQGWARTAREIRREEGILYHDAERLVRTESLIASDEARRESYQANGVEYVQRMATMDDRVCGYCAERAGNVYRAEDAPAALHPNDRCYNAPWKPEWQEAGLTDDEWFRKHRLEAIAKAEAAGEKRRTGAAPFEKAEEREPPTPIWTP